MTSRIQALSAEVVHLIAAGEVIDSLAAVVRELAENALDAGATRITVSLSTDQWRICVADNGRGMDLDDLQQAALPHSTSKIRDSRDLWQITSLGFRGEALHSLAQLADLEVHSRWIDADEGWCIRYDRQGIPTQVQPVAIAPGTIVTASNLFGNWLPRRQALPALAQQMRMVQLTIQHLALCHPQVTWEVEQNDRPWFNFWAASSAKQILPQILREVQPGDLQALEFSPCLSLLLGLPDRCHRHRPDWIKVAINGRVVKAPELEQTIMAAMRRTLPRDRHPVCFLHLQIPPDQVDWNRHPAKTEIYLNQLEDWQKQITEAIAQALQLGPANLPALYTSRLGHLIKTAEAHGNYGAGNQAIGKEESEPFEADADSENPASENSASENSASDHSAQSSEPLQADAANLTPDFLTPLKAIAQVHQMYILAEHPTGVWLVEQHIAHERVLYERLSDRWQLVPLEPPVILSHLSIAQREQLQRIGLEVEPFGDQLWAARVAPEPLAHREDCADALLELSLGGDLDTALVATACRTAIRNGTPLTLPEMQTLIDQWQQTRHPRTCPHGRPIYLPLEESSLSRFFRRHWVIGKSHGI